MKNDTQDREQNSISRRRILKRTCAALLTAAAGWAVFRHFSATSNVRVENFVTDGSGKAKDILVLTGSGREGGNSDLLAEAFARGAREAGHNVEIFACGRKDIHGCQHCEGCWSSGEPCVIEDDCSSLWPLLEKAQLLVFCSPLYWYNFSGQIKCAMDRIYPYSKKDRLRDLRVQECMLLMCGESPLLRSFAGPAEAYRQMLGYKHWKDRGRLFVTGVDEFGEMAGHKALETAQEMGRKA